MAEDNELTPEQLRDQLRDARGEAARYRTQLRDVEAERDGAFARVSRYQQSEIDHQLAVPIKGATGDKLWLLEHPEDLFTFGGVEMPGLLDDDGDVDPEAVQKAIAALLESRPGLFKEHIENPSRDVVREAIERSTGAIKGGAGGWAGLLGGQRRA